MHKEPTQHDSGEVRWQNAGGQKLPQADDAYSWMPNQECLPFPWHRNCYFEPWCKCMTGVF